MSNMNETSGVTSGTELVDAISGQLKRVSTQSLDISFNELLDMKVDGELNITPDYQRLFRWSVGQRSRFIESLILEMPVPPIFVIEEESGKYQLIDGLQRISSYLHLRGALEGDHFDPPIALGDKLVLTDCDIVTELNGRTFQTLPPSLQIRLKRSFIRVEVVRKGTDPHFKYHMFKRLNTGGERLSEQQIRNCAVRLLDSRFPNFLITASQNESFVVCTSSLTDARRFSAVDQELVLRYFALKNDKERFKHDVSDFLTEYMEDVSDPNRPRQFDYYSELENFEKTFSVLSAALGDKAFAFRNKARTDLASGFSILHFEAVTIGLQTVLDKLSPDNTDQMRELGDVLKRVKLEDEFANLTTGGGKNSPGPLRDRIAFVEGALTHAFR